MVLNLECVVRSLWAPESNSDLTTTALQAAHLGFDCDDKVGGNSSSAMRGLTEVREEKNPSQWPVYAMLRSAFSVTCRMFSRHGAGVRYVTAP